LQQRHVDRAVQTKIEFLCAGQMGAAVGGEIGPAACKMEIFDQQDLVRDLEAHGTDVLHLHVRDLNAERLEFGDCLQIAWRPQWTGDVERALAGECPVIVPGK
jgi:hypothetical protein